MRMTDGREGAEHRDREAGRIPGKLRIAEPPDIEHHVIGRGHRRRIAGDDEQRRSEEHTYELQSLMRISYAVFCLKKKKKSVIYIKTNNHKTTTIKTNNSNHKQ